LQGTSTEFSKAFESKLAEGQAQFASLVDNAARVADNTGDLPNDR